MNEKTLLAQFPLELTFFPDQLFEEALMGVAERCTTPPVPVYDYLTCLRLAAVDAQHEKALSLLCLNDITPAPLVLLPIDKVLFWNDVRAGKLTVWEQMHDAIIGVGLRCCQRAVAYSKPVMLANISAIQEASYDELNSTAVRAAFESQIHGAYLGPQTPYLVDPVLS